MSQPELDPIALDTAWDRQIRTGTTPDEVIAALHATDATPGPSTAFGQSLRRTLLAEALTIPRQAEQEAHVPDQLLWEQHVAAGSSHRPTRRGRFSKWTSVAASAALLLALAAGLIREGAPRQDLVINAPMGQSSPDSSSRLADVPMPGTDNQNSNVQPGPALSSAPNHVESTTSRGANWMVLADNKIIFAGYGGVKAIDDVNLSLVWATSDQTTGYWGPIVVSNGIALVGYTIDPETGGDDPDNNQLVALDLSDGHELWRTVGGGAYGSRPIVLDGTIYAVSGTISQAQFAAYNLTDGVQLWQVPLSGTWYCCTGIQVAASDGVAVVQWAYRAVGLSLENGRELWTVSSRNEELFGEPLIAGPTLVLNSRATSYPLTLGHQSQFSSNFGTTLLFDLQTGRQIGEVPDQMVNLAGIGDGDLSSFIAAGIDVQSGQTVLWRYSALTGEQMWMTDLKAYADLDRDYAAVSVDPVIAGSHVIVVSSVPDDGSGAIGQSLLTQVDAETGAIDWQVRFDGAITADPIVSGGRIFILTSDSGLLVFTAGSEPSASPAASPAVGDFRTPVACSAEIMESPLLGELPESPSISAAFLLGAPIVIADIPAQGESVDATTQLTLSKLFTEYRDCSAVDPYQRVFRFFSTDFYVRLLAGGPDAVEGGIEQPWKIWMAPMVDRLELDPATLIHLPDGRVGGIVRGTWDDFYVWFVDEGGQWKIDEYHRIEPDRPTNTPVPTLPPFGTPNP